MLAVVAIDSANSWQVVAFALLGELLAFVFVYRVLVRGGSPSSTLLWMLVILATPWFGLCLYYLLPRRLQLRRLRRLRVRGDRAREGRARAGGEAALARRTGLRALLAGSDGSGLVGGTTVRWLPAGADFLAATEAAIDAAQHHVHCLVYIFRPDAAGRRLLDVLARAAARGVQVRLLYDSFGSWGLKATHLQALRAAGGRAEPFLPLLWKRRPFTVNLRNHRKLLTVDGVVGFVGGRNVGDEYVTDRLGRARTWLDAMLELRGPVVERLQDVFAEDWCTATDEVLTVRPVAPPSPARGGVDVGVVCSGPDREESDLWFAMIQAIAEAEASIDLSSPYLVPPPTLLFALQLAAARGVRIRIYTNGPKVEAAVLYHAQRHHYRPMLAAGIELYETVQHYNHAKLLVVDGKHVMVGSANMDLRSAHLNFELAAMAVDAGPLAAAVLQTIERRRADFRRLSAADLPMDPVRRVVDGFCGMLSPLL
jgi:cardiolipin synthase